MSGLLTGTNPRPSGEEAAQAFIEQHLPDASAALLAGSVTRGEDTITSDLDLVIVVERPEAPYRESFRAFGWPIEAFVYTSRTYSEWFAKDAARRRPSLPQMCAGGIVLRDTDGLAVRMKNEAKALLEGGPAPLTQDELDWARYQVTDLLLDLEGALDQETVLYSALTLVPVLADLACDLKGVWRGTGKWLPRALSEVDPHLSRRFTEATKSAVGAGDARDLIELGDEVLARCGGRLFQGFAAGKGEG